MTNSTEFCEDDFNVSEVWAWEDDDEIENDALVPVPATADTLAGTPRVLIHSQLTTASGVTLNGLIIYNCLFNDVSAVKVVIKDRQFTFNKHWPSRSRDELLKLREALCVEDDIILPIRYSVVPELPVEDGEFSF